MFEIMLYIIQSIGGGCAGAGFVCAFTLSDRQTRLESAAICMFGVILLGLTVLLGGPVGFE